MAAAMRKLAADPPLREAMGNAGRRRIESQYLWKHKAAFYESAYARALRTAEPGRLAASQPQA
jgi:glycosyltransferase involved in cell wall biosynthesis